MDNAASLFGLAAVVLSLSAFVHVSVAAWARWRGEARSDRLEEGAAELAAQVATRVAGELRGELMRLEQAVEAQGTEIERIGEAQRFAARLLTERVAPEPSTGVPPRAPGRVVTPH